MDAKEIVHLAVKIEKFSADRSYENILILLHDLHTSVITAEQLETTDIVRVLYKLLKTCSESSVKKSVKALLSKWKREHGKDEHGLKCTEEMKNVVFSPPQVTEDKDSVAARAGVVGEENVTASTAKVASSTAETDGPQTRPSSDLSSVRIKCSQLLLTTLHSETSDQDTAARLAADIEQHIHALHKSNPAKYKACVRSKVSNLRNPRNCHLRRGLLNGSLSPEAFVSMSAEEMASAELRQLRERYSTEGLSERQLPRGLEGTETQKIRCKRCGGSDCRVTQVSRGVLFLPAWVRPDGPDDDAMTYVTCSSCGQQWYHSGWVCL